MNETLLLRGVLGLLEELKRERYQRSELERATLESLTQRDGQQQLPTVRPALGVLPPRRPWWHRWLGYHLRGMQERQHASAKASTFYSLGRG